MSVSSALSRKEARLAALREALDSGTLRPAQRMVAAMHPAEIALLLESLPPRQRELVWSMVDPEIEGDVLLELNENVRQELIEEMATEELVAAREAAEAADRARGEDAAGPGSPRSGPAGPARQEQAR